MWKETLHSNNSNISFSLFCRKTGGDDDDGEITSESDEASGNESEKETKVSEVAMKRKISNDEYPSFLAKRHKSFQTYRYSILPACTHHGPMT